MDKLAEASAGDTSEECCRTLLWDAVEDAASVILARYNACHCPAWMDVALEGTPGRVLFRKDDKRSLLDLCHMSIGRLRVPSGDRELMVRMRVQFPDDSYVVTTHVDTPRDFGTLVYERYHGWPRHGERTLKLLDKPQLHWGPIDADTERSETKT